MFVKQHNGRFHHLSQRLNHARAYVVDFIQRQQGCTDGPDAPAVGAAIALGIGKQSI